MRSAIAQKAEGKRASASETENRKGNALTAAIYDFCQRWAEGSEGVRLRQTVLGGATGRVVEIGIGTGISLPYYRRADKIVGVEPDPAWLRRARKRAQQLGLEVELHQGAAEALPFPDDSFDTAVATLVLCSVDNPNRTLQEIKRVLKPGGTFRFIEHIRADEGRSARLQDMLTPLWKRLSTGCHLNRPTRVYLSAEGFEIVEMLAEIPNPLQPVIAGVARPAS